jgi:hypothetical protein
VSKQDLSQLDGEKANKKDTEDIMDAVRLINGQMQQAIVLMQESVMLHVSKQSDNKNHFFSRVDALARQV